MQPSLTSTKFECYSLECATIIDPDVKANDWDPTLDIQVLERGELNFDIAEEFSRLMDKDEH